MSGITAERLTGAHPDFARAQALYVSAFPENERQAVPFATMADGADGHNAAWVYHDGDVFIGFSCMLVLGGLAHILYFAVDGSLRGKGYGSMVLESLAETYPGQILLADIERPMAGAKNEAYREKRRQFYLHNGFAPTDITYTWKGEDYEILSRGGPVTEAEFDAFWQYFDTHSGLR